MIPQHASSSDDRRLIVPFALCVVPALPIFLVGVYLVASPESWSAMTHPLGLLVAVVALLVVALPVRLAIYVFALRESSPVRRKVGAAIQCGIPSLGVFYFGLDIVERGATAPRLLLLAFCSCYFAAFVLLLLHVFRDVRRGMRQKPAA